MVHALVQKAVGMGLVEKENADIYEYGLADLLYTVSTWALVLLIALCADKFTYMLVFMLMHIPLRIYAGGLHLSTRFRCFCVSLLIFAIVFLMPYLFNELQLAKAILWLAVLNFALIAWLAPVEDLHKPLNAKERRHHKKIALAVCTVGVAAIALCFVMHSFLYAYYIGAAITTVSVQLLLGMVKNSLKNSSQL